MTKDNEDTQSSDDLGNHAKRKNGVTKRRIPITFEEIENKILSIAETSPELDIKDVLSEQELQVFWEEVSFSGKGIANLLINIQPSFKQNYQSKIDKETEELAIKILSPLMDGNKFSKQRLKDRMIKMTEGYQDQFFRDIRWLIDYYKKPFKNKQKIKEWLPQLKMQIEANKGKIPVENIDQLIAAYREMQEQSLIKVSTRSLAKQIKNTYCTFYSEGTIINRLSNNAYQVELKISNY